MKIFPLYITLSTTSAFLFITYITLAETSGISDERITFIKREPKLKIRNIHKLFVVSCENDYFVMHTIPHYEKIPT